MRWFLIAAGLSMTACEDTLAPMPDEKFVLRIGESAAVQGLQVGVRFAGIADDSRCPTTVTCVWEGDAQPILELTDGLGTRRVDTLHTSLDPRTALIGNGVVELLQVDPYPQTTDSIADEDYTITLVARSRAIPPAH